MKNIRKKFENETKTRINIISSANLRKSKLQEILFKKGVFNKTDFVVGANFTKFSTEILCSSPRNNTVKVYLNIKKDEVVLEEMKDNIFKSLYESCLIFEDSKDELLMNELNEEGKINQIFFKIINRFYGSSLNLFYETENIQEIFSGIKFPELLSEIKKIGSSDVSLEDNDNIIWNLYFKDFESDLKKQYYKWMKIISKYYADNEEGHEYCNENQKLINDYENRDFEVLCKLLYGKNSSCALMIERAYIEVPSNKEQFTGIVFIDSTKEIQDMNIARVIENRISEDYKELFLIIGNFYDDIVHFSNFRENINIVSLYKRIFCIINDFQYYKEKISKDSNAVISLSEEENIFDKSKIEISKKIGIPKDRIIITDIFNDIDKNTLETLNTTDQLNQLIKFIKRESENVGKNIKIKHHKNGELISISLNQERMSVQALMAMLYERYNGYLVGLWNKIIETEESSTKDVKYNYSKINTIIRNRTDDYKEFKHFSVSQVNKSIRNTIDFSLRSGDSNDSKKILKMLVNYGYNTVGFSSSENKIIVTVNGEISKEDKENLIKSIKGRLEESVINYFESAFLMDISRKKFNIKSFHNALEIEKNISIDDFYSAFKEIFKKMSNNILRYEVNVQ